MVHRSVRSKGMICTALDQDVALLEKRLLTVDNGVDLTFQHDNVVHGGGSVRHRIAQES